VEEWKREVTQKDVKFLSSVTRKCLGTRTAHRVYLFNVKMKQVLLHVKFKGIVHHKMKLLSSFTHPHVVPDLYELLI